MGVAKISNIFTGRLIFFGVKGRCWARAYACRKMRVPTLPGCTHLVQFVHDIISKLDGVCLFGVERRINPCVSLASDGINLNMMWMEKVKICKIK